ncbi:hypothetical protein BZG36_02579 [Bifiguratus adelaidae]|uniref:C3H1-type domain-containing protein n=1 Tax=Bifiguratus adelaidae TaxID=1938954 RepID=A0A261Y0Z3_9FUNG|nr:hypothetical protein BZG36_02579 [Bifiguratus adelaidae]
MLTGAHDLSASLPSSDTSPDPMLVSIPPTFREERFSPRKLDARPKNIQIPPQQHLAGQAAANPYDQSDSRIASADWSSGNRGRQASLPPRSSGSGRSHPNVSHVPCKFYRMGACSAGVNCQFSHSISVGAAPTTVCKYFLKGNCRFGSKCALPHIIPRLPRHPQSLAGVAPSLPSSTLPSPWDKQLQPLADITRHSAGPKYATPYSQELNFIDPQTIDDELDEIRQHMRNLSMTALSRGRDNAAMAWTETGTDDILQLIPKTPKTPIQFEAPQRSLMPLLIRSYSDTFTLPVAGSDASSNRRNTMVTDQGRLSPVPLSPTYPSHYPSSQINEDVRRQLPSYLSDVLTTEDLAKMQRREHIRKLSGESGRIRGDAASAWPSQSTTEMKNRAQGQPHRSEMAEDPLLGVDANWTRAQIFPPSGTTRKGPYPTTYSSPFGANSPIAAETDQPATEKKPSARQKQFFNTDDIISFSSEEDSQP